MDVLRNALPRVFDEERFDHTARIWSVLADSPALQRAEANMVAQCTAEAVQLLLDRLHAPGQPPDRVFLGGLVRSALGVIETAAEVWHERTDGARGAESRAVFLELAQEALDHLRCGYGSASTPPIPDTTEGRP
ncbi:hypothetical protein [Kytococcus sp. Marseille-QA3725]